LAGEYTLRFQRKAAKELEALDHTVQPRILAGAETLRGDPFRRGSVKLQGDPARRIRIGDYRVLYEVDTEAKVVTILRVAHRREAYRRGIP
jgi:mRNA interferase RelE/StbE